MFNKEYALRQAKFHELQALWWMHSASNGSTTLRNVKRLDGTKFSKEELINDAMEISQNHIQLYNEISEKILEFDNTGCKECGGTENKHYLNCSIWKRIKGD